MFHASRFKVLSRLLSPIREDAAPSSLFHFSQIAIAAVVILTLCAGAVAVAQPIATTTDSNAIMGFETLGTWNVTGSAAQGFVVTITTDRTQGKAAYSVAKPPETVKLISGPVDSSATALAGIGNTGALLQIDIRIPKLSCDDEESSGSINGYVSSPSRGLNHVSLGQVDFSHYRAGIYNTISFTIPEDVGSALGGATFSDLTFEFDVTNPDAAKGAYLFDNLRVHSVELVQSPTGTPPPPGYGGSVNLVVFGNAPVAQSSALGPTQIPNGFHLKLGTSGGTTVELQLGLDGNPAFTCTYIPDATDSTGHSYILQSCKEGFKAGDLVNSNWVHLAIVDGDSTQEIRAQIAMNPMGDLTGAGLLPPMPTFWGDADTCIPAPVSGTVVTTSPSCASQVAEANQIVTNYFQQVIDAHPAPNWIVMPVPEFALRHGSSTTNTSAKRLALTPDDASTGPISFSAGDDLNPGGTFDAYWTLNGSLTPTAVAGTDQNKTQFNTQFFGDVVLFGKDVSIMSTQVTAETDSPETTPVSLSGTGTGTVSLVVFGSEVPGGSFSVDPSKGFTVNPTSNHEYDLPSIHVWIFSLTLGATANAGLKASSSAAPSGFSDLTVTPNASVGLHVSGGVNLVIAKGTVDAKVDLASFSTPLVAQTNWTTDSSSACVITANGSASGDKTIGSGGGEVDLNATVGICPICYSGSYTLFKWDPLASTSSSLFNDTLDAKFRLPQGLAACGTWQGTYSGQTISCAKRDAQGCCTKRGGTEVLSGNVTGAFSQEGSTNPSPVKSVSATINFPAAELDVTGTNTNGVVSLQTTVPGYCGRVEVPAGVDGTISSDGSTFTGSFYINRARKIVGTFTMNRTAPPQP
jgi:hypothetical protein